MKAIHRGIVEHGRVKFFDQIKWFEQLNSLAGQIVEVTIGKQRKKRSLNQNGYYHGVVVEILGRHLGYTPDEMHHALRGEFLKIPGDYVLPKSRSTTDLSTVEFEDYLTQIREWAAQLPSPCYIPLPNEVEY